MKVLIPESKPLESKQDLEVLQKISKRKIIKLTQYVTLLYSGNEINRSRNQDKKS